MSRPNDQRPQALTQNQVISVGQRIQFLMGNFEERRDELEAVLPPDLPFVVFLATVNQALRSNPEILTCTVESVINSCVKSAYDGLRLDGREAAIVIHSVKVASAYEKQAQYFPMVRGLIKKVLAGGKVIALEVEAIHANDESQVLRGTNPQIHHAPLLEGDRGKIIAFYSVATLASGHRTAEFMTVTEVEDVRLEAKTDKVWTRWFGEMGKKTVIRRHQKKLPSDRDVVDVEVQELFPQYQQRPHPQLAATPPPAAASARPTATGRAKRGAFGPSRRKRSSLRGSFDEKVRGTPHKCAAARGPCASQRLAC